MQALRGAYPYTMQVLCDLNLCAMQEHSDSDVCAMRALCDPHMCAMQVQDRPSEGRSPHGKPEGSQGSRCTSRTHYKQGKKGGIPPNAPTTMRLQT